MRVPQLTIQHLWVGFILWLVFLFSNLVVRFQCDLWQHLASGREMVESGQLLRADVFTHTIAGAPWIDQNWLSQIVLFEWYRVGGVGAVTLFVSSLYTLAFACLAYLCWRRSQSWGVAAVCTLIALTLGARHLTIRTQAFSTICFALELLVLWVAGAKRWTPLGVAAIVLLWTNTHGAFGLGIALPVLFLAGRMVTVAESEGWRRIGSDALTRAYALCTIVAVAAAFCNPNPGQTGAYVWGSMSKGVARNIQEWRPVGVASLAGITFYGSIALALVVLSFSRRRIDATEAILLVAFALLGGKAGRLLIWWGFVLAPILAAHVGTLFARGTAKPLSRPKRIASQALLLLAIGAVSLSLPQARAFIPWWGRSGRVTRPVDEPYALTEVLRDTGTRGNAFNSLDWGGYLMFHMHDRLKVFVDGRVDPFSDRVWADYLRVARGGDDWESVLDGYGVNVIIGQHTSMPGLLDAARRSPRWTETYADALGFVFEKKGTVARSTSFESPSGDDDERPLFSRAFRSCWY